MRTASSTTAAPPDAKPVHRQQDTELNVLLAATARGDREAFSRIYRLTSGPLFAIALRIVKRRELAEEVLQEAFICIWERAGSQRHHADSAYGWMITVVRHRAIDRIRRRSEAREVPLDDARTGDIADVIDAECLPDKTLKAALAKLTEIHRRALLYAFYCGFSHQQVADALEVPLGTAKSWIRRGLLQLRRELKH